MAMITYVFTINHVANMLGEDPELLEAIVCNDDTLSYGSLISVYDGTGAHAAARPMTGNDFLEDFVSDPDIIARITAKSPR
ncbi:hypothetical protein NKG99_32195 [Mesorhizobium sp. M1409]|uniref:hypothetical protein n=1 Tax=unclassified Mesorhizobium TaxID=325217 RepID=UPI0033369A5F